MRPQHPSRYDPTSVGNGNQSAFCVSDVWRQRAMDNAERISHLPVVAVRPLPRALIVQEPKPGLSGAAGLAHDDDVLTAF